MLEGVRVAVNDWPLVTVNEYTESGPEEAVHVELLLFTRPEVLPEVLAEPATKVSGSGAAQVPPPTPAERLAESEKVPEPLPETESTLRKWVPAVSAPLVNVAELPVDVAALQVSSAAELHDEPDASDTMGRQLVPGVTVAVST